MKLQYQLSNGNWVNCNDREEEFLSRCEEFNTVGNRQMTRAEVIENLKSGKELRNDSWDWYSNCRSGTAHEKMRAARIAAMPIVEMVKCSCGHTIAKSLVMSASMGSSCCDCYDRMSD